MQLRSYLKKMLFFSLFHFGLMALVTPISPLISMEPEEWEDSFEFIDPIAAIEPEDLGDFFEMEDPIAAIESEDLGDFFEMEGQIAWGGPDVEDLFESEDSMATVPADDEEPATGSDPKGSSIPWPKRIAISHTEGPRDVPGYPTNYSTLMILSGPDYTPDKFLPMIDLRGYRFDNTKYAASAGFVGRYIPGPRSSFSHILGANIYYDYLQGSFGPFNQVGAGIEILGKRLDFRANVYVPFNNSEHRKVCVFDDYIGDFVIINERVEFVSYGYNAEIGCCAVRTKDYFFYLAGDIYYLSGKNCNQTMRGGKFRIRPQYKDYIAIDLSVSYDSIFHTVYQGEVIISLPLYQISSKRDTRKTHGLTSREIYQPVERFDIMMRGRCCCWGANF